MAMKLNMLPPSVNNMSVRVFVRAAGIPVEEENVWGQTQEQEYLSKYPPGLTPTIEDDELPKGVLGESCAVMMYLSTREGRDDLYPSDPKKRAMVDAANFYTLSIFYPLMARATYPRLGFAGYPGEVSTSDASDEAEGGGAQVRGGLAAEDPRRLPRVLGHGHRLHRRRRHADDRRYQARGHARVSRGHRHRDPRLGEGLHRASRVGARRRVQRAGRRRARLRGAGHGRGGRRELVPQHPKTDVRYSRRVHEPHALEADGPILEVVEEADAFSEDD